MVEQNEQGIVDLGSDAPKNNPDEDAFGYAAFGRRIAHAVKTTPSPNGLVMAIQGQWGAGKSTLLNFVKHELSLRASDNVIVVDFNPWWFDDRNHLAAQFLAQFKMHLPRESEHLRGIGDLLSDYSGAIGTALSASYGIPLLDVPISAVLKFLGRKHKDVPTLKKEISSLLKAGNQRFLFVIDDIDRLTPDEIRELFKVIKALADFPNVIYLLSFDRLVVANALRAALHVDGEAYLEKIIQAPFSLPAVDQPSLRALLFASLDKILSSVQGYPLDAAYWQEVYYHGLDQYVVKPRDVVRLVNTLLVTYPAVAGEVNPVDYVAMEFLRVFDPMVYGTIRDNREMFVGSRSDAKRNDVDPARVFHETWLGQVTGGRAAHTRELICRMFPRASTALGVANYGNDWATTWRAGLRICSPEFFDVYFQFAVAPHSLSRAELNQLISVAESPDLAIQILTDASTVFRPDGRSKARDFLDRMRDLDTELTPTVARGLLIALFDVGDHLLGPGDSGVGMFSASNHWRLGVLLKHLLNHVAADERLELLRQFVANCPAIGLATYTLGSLQHYIHAPGGDSTSPFASFDAAAVDELKRIATDRIAAIPSHDFLSFNDMAMILYSWERWGSLRDIQAKVAPLFAADATLLEVLDRFKQTGTMQTSGSLPVPTMNCNPENFRIFTDIFALEPRVVQLLTRADIQENLAAVGRSFLHNLERMRQGMPTNGELDN